MNIIIENGDYQCSNMGDVAMLQVAISRLKYLWPTAKLQVLINNPTALAHHCPDVRPLAARGRDIWIRNGIFLGRLSKYFPHWLSARLNRLKVAIEILSPGFLGLMIRYRMNIRGHSLESSYVQDFQEAIIKADLLVVCGAGGFDNHCHLWNMTTLRTLKLAIRHEMPVAMFGQGMGPLSDHVVLKLAESVLPKVNLISLRGSKGGEEILKSLRVPDSSVITTGDEALELAYEVRSEALGHAMGVNLRVAKNSDVDKNYIKRIKPVLQQFAKRNKVELIPVPIACHAWAKDDVTIRQLLSGFDNQSDGGSTLDTPLKVIKQVGRCRIVVTGAYHAAVFALAQGIPVVALAKSPYYVAKFLGLEDQFGSGCQTVHLNEPGLNENLFAAIDKAWKSADEMNVTLRTAALRMINLSRGAYERFKNMVDRDMYKD